MVRSAKTSCALLSVDNTAAQPSVRGTEWVNVASDIGFAFPGIRQCGALRCLISAAWSRLSKPPDLHQSVSRRVAGRERLVRTLVRFVPGAARSVTHGIRTSRPYLVRSLAFTCGLRVVTTKCHRPNGAVSFDPGFRRDLLARPSPVLILFTFRMTLSLPDLVSALLDFFIDIFNHSPSLSIGWILQRPLA
jgi:hypothetical protein